MNEKELSNLNLDDYLSQNKAAKFLDVSVVTIIRYRRKGYFPGAIELPQVVFYPRHELEKFLISTLKRPYVKQQGAEVIEEVHENVDNIGEQISRLNFTHSEYVKSYEDFTKKYPHIDVRNLLSSLNPDTAIAAVISVNVDDNRRDQIIELITKPMKRKDIAAALLSKGLEISESTITRALRQAVLEGRLRVGASHGWYIPVASESV